MVARVGMSLLLVVAFLAPLGAAPALGATFTVTRLDDPAPDGCKATDCSLREAIVAANGAAGADSITLPAGTIELDNTGAAEDAAATGDLDITEDVTITGLGASSVVDGTQLADRVFDVASSAMVTMSKFTIQGGTAASGTTTAPQADGGGIRNAGTLTLSNVLMQNNKAEDGIATAPDGGHGGGIYNSGTLTITASTVAGNTSGKGATAPAVGSDGGNGGKGGNGGNIYNAGTLTITDSAVLNGTAADGGAGGNGKAGFNGNGGDGGDAGKGGGIYDLGKTTITNGTFTGNKASGPGGAPGARTGTGTVGKAGTGGSGGAMFALHRDASDGLTITRAGFVDNGAAVGGGGLLLDGNTGGGAQITNVQFSANNADTGGGAQFSTASGTRLSFVTVTGNAAASRGGGLFVSPEAIVLHASIVAGNTAPSAPDCDNPVTSDDYNLIGNASDCGFIAKANDMVGTGVAPIDARLGDALGTPPASSPRSNSPALNHIPVAACSVTVDAQGTARPQGKACDIGAKEAQIADAVGLVDIVQGVWHLQDSAGQITSFFFGNPGDLPIAGDWDGDGVATPGLYRQSDGFFYSRNSNTAGVATHSCFAGNANDIPVVGDWDGDGDDNLGLYRPSLQAFFLFTSSCANAPMGAAQITFTFGNPGDKPVAGDWDGDGMDEIGLHRESTGFFYWRNTNTTGIASGQIFFGDPGDRFVAGDWGVVDGVDTPGVFRPANLTFFFRHTLTQGVADSQFTWANANAAWVPVAGNFGLG